ncbi:MAG: family 10 glycosylhydrolase [Tannerellaceae bacterium]|nr:family 10 glycosylhydrolase [Tannerellaceae bacterium]
MKSLRLFILLFTITTLFACSSEKVVHQPDYPMFWTWLNYRPSMNFDSVCVVMKETGIDGVMLNAPTPDDYRQAIPIAHKHGIEVYAWLWTMNLEHDRDKIIKEHPEWFSVNRKGESLADSKAYVDYYKFMCPALPEVREYIKNKIKAYCEVEGLNGIAIDYHRFVDVILPTTLWPRYEIVQDREYPQWDYGYHPAMIELFEAQYGYDPREQEDPSTDDKWLQFRCDQITKVTNEIADVVHSYGKVMAASPFPTPAMSRQMVRQDWGKWNLDIVFPMVYHNFYTGDVSFISDCTIDNAKDKNPNTTLSCGMMISADSEEIFDCMDAALNNGAEGVAIFTIGSLRSPEIRNRFKAYTDSVKELRNKNTYPVQVSRTVNTNPFENKGIMSAIQMRMQAYISIANATRLPALEATKWETVQQVVQNPLQANTQEEYVKRLTNAPRRDAALQPVAEAIAGQFMQDNGTLPINQGTYTLTKEYGVTKCYQVTEQNSEITFDVTFYFYGGVLSGWSIEPEKTSYEKYREKI